MNTRCSNKHANTVPTSRGLGVSVHTPVSAQAGAMATETVKFRKENLVSHVPLDEVRGMWRRDDKMDANRVRRAYHPAAQITHREPQRT